MARLRRRVLDANAPLYVWHRDLSINGRVLLTGEVVPWRDLGIDLRKVKQLWQQRRLDNEQPPARPVATQPPPRRGRPPKPRPQPAAE